MKTITRLTLLTSMVCGFALASAQVPSYTPPALGYDAEDVLSFLSDNYGEAFDLTTPNWGATSRWDYSATADATDDTGLVLELTDLGWIAVRLEDRETGKDGIAPTKQYEYFHIDVFCNEETDFRVGLHSNYPVNGNEVYFPVIEKGTMTPGKWYSIDYPIGDLKYTEADNAETTSWIVDTGYADATYIRFGNGINLFEYAKTIYVANIMLFNGTPTCLGGKVIDSSSGIAGIKSKEFNLSQEGNLLNCESDETIRTIHIYSVTGQNVKSVTVNKTQSSINITNLTSGIYIVSVEFANGETVSRRILK